MRVNAGTVLGFYSAAIMFDPAFLTGETWGFGGAPVEHVETHTAHAVPVAVSLSAAGIESLAPPERRDD